MKTIQKFLFMPMIGCLLTLFSLSLRAATDSKQIKVCGQNVQNFFYSLDRTRTTTNGIPISNYTDVVGRTAKLNAIIDALSPYKADIYAFIMKNLGMEW